MRDCHEPTSTWLPSTDEIFMAPERATLAALDATLQLVIRTLRAEYPGLDESGRLIQDPDWEPYVPPQVPLIERIVGSAAELHLLIIQFRTTLDLLLQDGSMRDDLDASPRGEQPEEGDDIPF
jgi:hypothetical protein